VIVEITIGGGRYLAAMLSG